VPQFLGGSCTPGFSFVCNHTNTFLYVSVYSHLFFLSDPCRSPMAVSLFGCFSTMYYHMIGMFVVHMLLFHLNFFFSSCRVNPKWVIYHSLVSTDRQYMRNVISIDPSWLTEVAPHFYQHQRNNVIGH
jgi:hypothetical protein